jgi:hypothetical protein
MWVFKSSLEHLSIYFNYIYRDMDYHKLLAALSSCSCLSGAVIQVIYRDMDYDKPVFLSFFSIACSVVMFLAPTSWKLVRDVLEYHN